MGICEKPVLLDAWKVSEEYALKRQVWNMSSKYYVGCGECKACEERHSIEWTHRLLDEYAANEKSCFVTLTYNDDYVPAGYNLRKKDYQDFLKRLRKHYPEVKIRYFGCGEYGGSGANHRPHFHFILFGVCFDDLVFFKMDKSGQKLYRSPTLEKIWTYGFSSVGIEFSMKVVKYLTKYLQKQNIQVVDRIKPFVAMSLGIGKEKIDSKAIETDKIYHDGRYTRLPRYYLDKLELKGLDLSDLKKKRMQKAVILDDYIGH